MTNKNEVGYWIKRKGHEKFLDTKPEMDFYLFCKAKGLVILGNQIPVWIDAWRLTPDFDMAPNIVILIDGRYHWTDAQAKKDRWRDELYQKAGKRVIHIDAGLTLERYWVDLAYLFKAALESSKQVVYIHQ